MPYSGVRYEYDSCDASECVSSHRRTRADASRKLGEIGKVGRSGMSADTADMALSRTQSLDAENETLDIDSDDEMDDNVFATLAVATPENSMPQPGNVNVRARAQNELQPRSALLSRLWRGGSNTRSNNRSRSSSISDVDLSDLVAGLTW